MQVLVDDAAGLCAHGLGGHHKLLRSSRRAQSGRGSGAPCPSSPRWRRRSSWCLRPWAAPSSAAQHQNNQVRDAVDNLDNAHHDVVHRAAEIAGDAAVDHADDAGWQYTAVKAIIRETRAPSKARMNRSRPMLSVPNTWWTVSALVNGALVWVTCCLLERAYNGLENRHQHKAR